MFLNELGTAILLLNYTYNWNRRYHVNCFCIQLQHHAVCCFFNPQIWWRMNVITGEHFQVRRFQTLPPSKDFHMPSNQILERWIFNNPDHLLTITQAAGTQWKTPIKLHKQAWSLTSEKILHATNVLARDNALSLCCLSQAPLTGGSQYKHTGIVCGKHCHAK